MKLDFDEQHRQQMVTSYGTGFVRVGLHQLTQPCVLAPEGVIEDLLPDSFTGLSPAHVTAIAALRPDVLLFGTGARQLFPGSDVLRALVEARVGYEFMVTAAACRSYNILVSDNRRVVAAMFMQ